MQSLASRRPFGKGFIAGLAAGAVASGVMLFLSSTFGGLSLPESFGSELTALMPPPMFAFLHQLIGGDAKTYLFVIILIGQCLVFAFSGALYNRLANSQDRSLDMSHGFLLALILWVFAGFILLPLTGSGVFGAGLTTGFVSGMISLGIVGVVFGGVFVYCQRWLVDLRQRQESKASGSEDEYDAQASRRALLKRGVLVAGIAVVGVGVWHFITSGFGSPQVSPSQLLQNYRGKVNPPTPNYGEFVPVQYLSPEVTPNDQYYVVSKNFTDPTVGLDEWSLKVDGLVDQPYTLSYTELLALPMQKQYESMECVSNEVGGPYMSNALWEGTRLSNLLRKAGVRAGATKVVLYGYDNYVDSILLNKALEETTLVAVRMNGATLPDTHGYPARVLVPGIYGMKHVKWLTHIEVVNTNFQGYWQQRGWSDPAPVRLNVRIDTPIPGSTIHAGNAYIGGVAFSGNKGISEVDVSLDGGHTWQRATLKRPLSPLTWVLWELPWHAKAGDYVVTARAIDLEGNVQDPHEEPTLPNGASGYHSISVTVS
ncbi:MAG TPA: molybdopterin-dependent oxidoreductase [Ktedonobacteraceae bacterium]|nr:molybdopterin-dependent oxidoreductase [Ktedonobacteraceae bacterium]